MDHKDDYIKPAGDILFINFIRDPDFVCNEEIVSIPESENGENGLWIYPVDGDQLFVPLHQIRCCQFIRFYDEKTLDSFEERPE